MMKTSRNRRRVAEGRQGLAKGLTSHDARTLDRRGRPRHLGQLTKRFPFRFDIVTWPSRPIRLSNVIQPRT